MPDPHHSRRRCPSITARPVVSERVLSLRPVRGHLGLSLSLPQNARDTAEPAKATTRRRHYPRPVAGNASLHSAFAIRAGTATSMWRCSPTSPRRAHKGMAESESESCDDQNGVARSGGPPGGTRQCRRKVAGARNTPIKALSAAHCPHSAPVHDSDRSSRACRFRSGDVSMQIDTRCPAIVEVPDIKLNTRLAIATASHKLISDYTRRIR